MLLNQLILAEIELPAILQKELEAATAFHILTLLIFALAVFHTLISHHFTNMANKVAKQHAKKTRRKREI